MERLLQKYLKIQHKYLDIKHETCKHPNGCLTQCFDITTKGFLIGFVLKGTVTILFSEMLKKKNFNPLKLIKSLFTKEVMSFTYTPMVYNMVLQTTTCLLRWQNNKQLKRDAFISGFLAGFIGLLTKPKNSRQIWAVFLLSRAFECGYNSLVNKGYLPKSQWNWVFIFALIWLFLGSQCGVELGNLPKSFLKFENNMCQMDSSDIAMFNSSMSRVNRAFFLKNGNIPVDPSTCFIKPVKQFDIFGNYKK